MVRIFLFFLLIGNSASFGQDANQLIQTACIACHNQYTMQGGLDLHNFNVENAHHNPIIAEKVIRKLRAGQMPPWEMQRNQTEVDHLAHRLEKQLDHEAKNERRAGSRPFQRVNHAEYSQLIYDLLGLTVNTAKWFPEDRISASFDNIADAQEMSATLMTAYLTAASEIARQAIGDKEALPSSTTYSNSPGQSQHQWERVEGAPYGTRGGISTLHNFPADGEYVFSMRFMSGWGERYEDIDISINRERAALIQYGGDIDYQGLKDFPIETNPVFVKAGQQRVTATFIRKMDGPYEDLLKPNARSLTGTEIGYGTTSPPNLMHLTIEGPTKTLGVSETPARKRIFECRPTTELEEKPCAKKIISKLAEQAFNRDLTDKQLNDLMRFYSMGTETGGFELGIRTALEAILASPRFLFRIEREPDSVRPGSVYRISGSDLANRLSFFLWGTSPDKELSTLGKSGRLTKTKTLSTQVKRMLKDPRAESLATRFAALWLRLQDLEKVEPEEFWYPNYTQQLMQAMRRETELFFNYLVQQDRSMLELYNADYSFMNERLARHYGIPNVNGNEFRKVHYPNDQRRGILGHGSILTQTSLGNRTSPVLRGKWVVEVLLGTPPPPPPPGIPDLEETATVNDGRVLTTSRRTEMHRANPVCAACHKIMDPIGLALDNFDVTGKWRIRENDMPLETQATFYDGSSISNLAELTAALLKRPTPLVREFTANLMAYAIARRIEHFDQPRIREIVQQAEKDNYRMSSLIMGIIMSDAFRMKESLKTTELVATSLGSD